VQVIPVSALYLWTEFEVERLVCGRPTIDVEMLRRHTQYSGLTGEEPHVQYFWQVLTEFGQVGGACQERKTKPFQQRMPCRVLPSQCLVLSSV
jgi:hypothetical protein